VNQDLLKLGILAGSEHVATAASLRPLEAGRVPALCVWQDTSKVYVLRDAGGHRLTDHRGMRC
jgi:hypothetical protein